LKRAFEGAGAFGEGELVCDEGVGLDGAAAQQFERGLEASAARADDADFIDDDGRAVQLRRAVEGGLENESAARLQQSERGLEARDVDLQLPGNRLDLFPVIDQDGMNQAQLGGIDGGPAHPQHELRMLRDAQPGAAMGSRWVPAAGPAATWRVSAPAAPRTVRARWRRQQ